jgi:hypothetical protein
VLSPSPAPFGVVQRCDFARSSVPGTGDAHFRVTRLSGRSLKLHIYPETNDGTSWRAGLAGLPTLRQVVPRFNQFERE